MTPSRLREVAGAVLLGGASSRMGRDKASVTLGGVAMATRIARRLGELCADVVLVGGIAPPDAPGRRVPDPDGPACPLRGLAGAFAATHAERVLVVATDLPLVTPTVLLALVAWPGAAAVAPRQGGRAQPLCALYERAPALAAAERRLRDGRLSAHGLLEELDAAYLDDADLARVDPDGRALSNLNAPEELARAEAWLARAT